MNYSYLSTNNFSPLIYPNLSNLKDSNLSLLTHTSPITSCPTAPAFKNPMAIHQSDQSTIFWSHVGRIFKTTVSSHQKKLVVLSHTSRTLDSPIVSISIFTSSSENLLLVECSLGYSVLDFSLETVQHQHIAINDIHLNPYCPNQIVFLTSESLCVVSKNNLALGCSGFKGFEFQFSPFVVLVYNDRQVCIRDLRQDREERVIEGSGIRQVLPIDCCGAVAVLGEEVKIYDSRFWKSFKTYWPLTHERSGYLVSFPLRSRMYEEGPVSDTHQSLYIKGAFLEKLSHKVSNPLEGFMASLKPLDKMVGKMQSSIESSVLFPLMAAFPINIGSSNFWVQSSTNGGLFIENAMGSESLTSIIMASKLINDKTIETANFYDKKEWLENLINEKFEVPKGNKPQLQYSVKLDFADFEDFDDI